MMANWNLRGLNKALSGLSVPLLLLTGQNDTMIPASDGQQISKLVKGAQLINMENLGHLLHEEAPSDVAEQIITFADKNVAKSG